MTGGPGKEHGTNKPPPIRRVRERSRGDTTCRTTSQNPSLWHPSWLNKVCTTRKDSESEWLAKDSPETNPIIINLETASHVTEQFSWVPSPSCSPPGRPFPIISLALSAHVSPQTIHFRVLDKRTVSGPGRGPPSCNTSKYLRAQECPVPTTAGHCKQREEFWIRKGKLPLLKINLSQCDFFYFIFTSIDWIFVLLIKACLFFLYPFVLVNPLLLLLSFAIIFYSYFI